MSKDAKIAEKVAKWAEGDLVEAREFTKSAGPENQRLARQMARAAKRRRSKANRRAGRAFCRDYEDEMSVTL